MLMVRVRIGAVLFLFCAVACGVGAAASHMGLFGARAARARDRRDQLASNAALTRVINRQFT